MAQIIDGKALVQYLNNETASKTAAYCASQQLHTPPCLAIICVGDNSASQTYIKAKQKALKEAGMHCTVYRFPENVPPASLTETLTFLNSAPQVHGILLQLPLPQHIDVSELIELISPIKDVDGFTPVNLGKLLSGSGGFIPCTAQAVMYALQAVHIPTAGSHAVIVGRSCLVGKPLAALLTHADATVTVCHSKTQHLAQVTRQADILIAAAGCPVLITADMVKEGAAVIDIGINRIEDFSAARGYRITGDVDFAAVEKKARWITPVPGGIGPLTVAMLLKNTLKAACLQHDFPMDTRLC